MYSCAHRVSSTISSRTGPSWPPSRSGVCTDAAGQILSSLSAGNATMPTLQQGPQGQFQIILGFFLVITLERVICVCNILTFNREKAVWVSADIVEKLCSHKRKRQDCARGVGYCWAGECWKIAFMKPCNLWVSIKIVNSHFQEPLFGASRVVALTIEIKEVFLLPAINDYMKHTCTSIASALMP